jgi:hypothetical protein
VTPMTILKEIHNGVRDLLKHVACDLSNGMRDLFWHVACDLLYSIALRLGNKFQDSFYHYELVVGLNSFHAFIRALNYEIRGKDSIRNPLVIDESLTDWYDDYVETYVECEFGPDGCDTSGGSCVACRTCDRGACDYHGDYLGDQGYMEGDWRCPECREP